MTQQQRVVEQDGEHRETAVTYQHILYEVSDKIATITLHRPDQLRAMPKRAISPISSRRARSLSSSGSFTTCRFRPWPKPPSTPTGKWWWRCAAAISAKAWRGSWRSDRRGLRGSEGCLSPRQPVFAL